MKKIIGLLVSLTLMLSIVPMTVMAEDETVTYAGGSGTSSSPWQIATAAQLKLMRDTVNADDGKNDVSKYWVLTADIDLGGEEWEPIGWSKSGNYDYEFSGTFDGAGHVVKNFVITQAAQVKSATDGTYYYNNIGLFGSVLGGTIKNLGVENFTATVNEPDNTAADAISNIGGIVGRFSGTMTKCYAKNITVQKLDNYVNTSVGAVIGTIRGTSTITDCYAYGVSLSGTSKMLGGAFHRGIESATTNVSKLTNCYASNVTFGGNAQNVYGFGMANSSGVSLTYTNCWSTAADLSGCDNAVSKGTLGATKEGIITALVTDGGSYIVDEDVNDGYPCLDFEKPALVAANAYAGGTGTSTDPYQIATAEQLMYARDMVNDGTHKTKSFVLTADIDLEGSEWEPMGTFWKENNNTTDAGQFYSGTFDGGNHVIKNFKITQAYHGQIGFFGYTSGATVKNLGIEDMNINYSIESNGNVGGMIGYGSVTATNCYIKNSEILAPALRYYSVGGFMGKTRFASTFENCYLYGCTLRAKDNSNVAGFISSIERDGNVVTNCYVANTQVHSSNQAAVYPFICNKAKKTITLEGCYSELASAEGTTTNTSNKYNATYAYGTYTNLMSDITGTLGSVEGYKLDNAINGGYPSFTWETAPIVVTPNPYVIAAVNTNGMVKVSILENSAVSGAKVYVASYDVNGRLLNADVRPVTAGTQTSAVDATGATTIKVFVWDPNQTPLANMYSK